MEPVSRKFIPEKLLFDTRMIDRNLRDGIISRAEYDAHLKNLKGTEASVKVMETQFRSTMHDEVAANDSDEE